MAENKTTVTKNKTPYLNYPFSLSSRYIPLYLIPPPPLPLPDSGEILLLSNHAQPIYPDVIVHQLTLLV